MSVRVLAPIGAALLDLPGVEAVRFENVEGLVAGLKRQSRVVIVSDGLEPDDLLKVAQAIRDGGVMAIEVQSHGWDGESHSPLTAACRGVIGGFGLSAVSYAVEMLNADV